MHYDSMVYRPPFEADSLLLQVTSGCSHNKCTFCAMYRDVRFRISPMEEVVADIEEAALMASSVTRVFLENGDAFALPADRLLEIAELIHANLPSVSMITGYASVRNITGKTDAELKALAGAGYGQLNVGLESGLDDVLAFMNKGFTLEEARRQLLRLKACGMQYALNIILAAAGPERVREHALANAAICNELDPWLLFVSPLHVDEGSDLARISEESGFAECTLGQYIEEEMLFLENLHLSDCIFYGMHVSNPVPVFGHLPNDKDRLLATLGRGMQAIDRDDLDSHPLKGSEGGLTFQSFGR